MVEVMRKNQFTAEQPADFTKFNDASFNEQQTLMKNVIAKNYQIKLLTSFNERTVYGVVGKNATGQFFYALDKNLPEKISTTELKTLL